jgi:membrane protease YdiL (CAAX protease family)
LFALSGLLFYDVINKRGFQLKPKFFTPLSGFLLIRVIVILAGLAVIQATVQFIPMTVKTPEIALAVVFAGPSEENFFRGVLISIVIVFFSNIGFKIRVFKKEISIWVLFGIVLTGIAFGAIHVNYYNDFSLLLGTILCGIWLGITYWYFDDLTAAILAHFILNLIVMWPTIFTIFF